VWRDKGSDRGDCDTGAEALMLMLMLSPEVPTPP
jgi:hypothetical protein